MWSENFLPTATALRIGNVSRWQSDHLTAQRSKTDISADQVGVTGHITNKKEKKALTDRYKGGLASLKYREKFNGRVRKAGEALHAYLSMKNENKERNEK